MVPWKWEERRRGGKRSREKEARKREDRPLRKRQLDISKVTNQQENSWEEVSGIYDGRELTLMASGRWSLLSQI